VETVDLLKIVRVITPRVPAFMAKIDGIIGEGIEGIAIIIVSMSGVEMNGYSRHEHFVQRALVLGFTYLPVTVIINRSLPNNSSV
jgi:hypothetical protein